MTAPFLTQPDLGQEVALNFKSFTHWELHSLMLNELKAYHHVQLYPDYMIITVFHDVEQEVLKIRELVKEAGFTAHRAVVLSRNIVIERL